ncbi:long-subunit fatty acid transport protein [Mucilaginibacter auburnensis]|uniref:Long-subunit fatty acid transport protein n=2 Tax=Mucilaginibacter auburnensis TaxID=1457233 RepID=A0A2H9VVW2_9SPHI|nr:long-subunit fatty acid transport protein [Mucilaginibacter auburnensis]
MCLIALTAIGKSSFAQYAKDAIRFSTGQTGTTSRLKGMGSANVAVGGDLTSVGGNPAGLGFFTRSEISITPEFNGTKNNASYLGENSSGSKNSGNLNNFSAVFYSRMNTPRGRDKTKGWLSVNFGVGYNRTNDFGDNINYGGTNKANSINDYYGTLATNSGTTGDFVQGYAYDHFLIDQYGTAGNYEANNPRNGANLVTPVKQANAITRTGGQSEFNLSLGANYSNKLYLGFGIGITSLRYNSTNMFNEVGSVNNDDGTTGVFSVKNYNSTYSQFQATRGAGFNAKIGAIYKIEENVRLGAQITSPTWMSIDDIYSESLNTSYSTNNKRYNSVSPDYTLTYTMRTPFKAAGGLSVFFGKAGFITGDVEYVDYSSTKINSSDAFDASYDNSIIRNNYKGAVNARFGAEVKVATNLMLRGGYGLLGSPLKTDGKTTTMGTAGLGYRFGTYYIDAAYQHVSATQVINPYLLTSGTPGANVNRVNDNLFLTLGVRF